MNVHSLTLVVKKMQFFYINLYFLYQATALIYTYAHEKTLDSQ